MILYEPEVTDIKHDYLCEIVSFNRWLYVDALADAIG